jgi:DNA-binding transcriptional MocR family regulator
MNKINWCHAIGQSGLRTTVKCVAFAIGAHMNAAGEANPSQARLADYASVSVRTVYTAIKRLEADELLRVERVQGRRASYFAAKPTPEAAIADDLGSNGFRGTSAI